MGGRSRRQFVPGRRLLAGAVPRGRTGLEGAQAHGSGQQAGVGEQQGPRGAAGGAMRGGRLWPAIAALDSSALGSELYNALESHRQRGALAGSASRLLRALPSSAVAGRCGEAGRPTGEGPGRGAYAAGGAGRTRVGTRGRGVSKGLRGGAARGREGLGEPRLAGGGAPPPVGRVSSRLRSVLRAVQPLLRRHGRPSPGHGVSTLLSVPCASCRGPEMPDGLHPQARRLSGAPLWRPFPRSNPFLLPTAADPLSSRDALLLLARRTCGGLAGVGGREAGARRSTAWERAPEGPDWEGQALPRTRGGWGQIRPGTGDQIPAAPPRSGQPLGDPSGRPGSSRLTPALFVLRPRVASLP